MTSEEWEIEVKAIKYKFLNNVWVLVDAFKKPEIEEDYSTLEEKLEGLAAQILLAIEDDFLLYSVELEDTLDFDLLDAWARLRPEEEILK